jgi:hypothetical protein
MTGVDIEDLNKNVEYEGEVEDKYSSRPIRFYKQKIPATSASSTSNEIIMENTPTKSTGTASQSETPLRRSPRGHAKGIVITIIKFTTTDLEGVDKRLDIPKIIIFANKESTNCHDVTQLRTFLAEKTDERLKTRFDLCE